MSNLNGCHYRFIGQGFVVVLLSKIIVCIVGMPGAGKSTIANGLETKGYPVLNMGNAIRVEASERGIEPTGENLGNLMLEVRQKHGPGVVAQLIKPQVVKNTGTVIVDGVRSEYELDVLRECGDVKLLAVHASTDTRLDFLIRRGRTDDPDTRDEMSKRDRRELSVGISDPIALADASISNSSMAREELVDVAHRIVQGWEA